jgi:bisphosphoglycerate-dependent phosphoglycerate mutase
METKEPKKDEVHYWRDQIMPKFLSVSTLLVVVEDSAIREIF